MVIALLLSSLCGLLASCSEFVCSCFRAEAESLRHLSAQYCPLVPPPRSTIAAAFSPDGKTLASTQQVFLLWSFPGHACTNWKLHSLLSLSFYAVVITQ